MNWSNEIGRERLFNKAFIEHGRSDVVLWDVIPIRDVHVRRWVRPPAALIRRPGTRSPFMPLRCRAE